jgi:hypothetical protein
MPDKMTATGIGVVSCIPPQLYHPKLNIPCHAPPLFSDVLRGTAPRNRTAESAFRLFGWRFVIAITLAVIIPARRHPLAAPLKNSIANNLAINHAFNLNIPFVAGHALQAYVH